MGGMQLSLAIKHSIAGKSFTLQCETLFQKTNACNSHIGLVLSTYIGLLNL